MTKFLLTYGFLSNCERSEPRSHFKSRLSLIVRVNVVLNRTVVVDSNHLQTLKMITAQVVETSALSTTTVLFRTTFTRTIKLNLLLVFCQLFCTNLRSRQFLVYLSFVVRKVSVSGQTRNDGGRGEGKNLVRLWFIFAWTCPLLNVPKTKKTTTTNTTTTPKKINTRKPPA